MAIIIRPEFGEFQRDPNRLFIKPDFGQFAPPVTHTITVSGGISAGGAATVSVRLAVLKFIPAGGLTVAGAATVRVRKPLFVPIGGFTVAGTSTANVRKPLFVTSGGLRVTGSAVVRTRAALYVPTGGQRIGGAARVRYNPVFKATGGITIGGAATVRQPIFRPKGGLVVSGSASFLRVSIFRPSGGFRLGGVGPRLVRFKFIASSGARLQGTAAFRVRLPRHIPTGGLKLEGTALNYLLPSGVVATAENPYNSSFEGWAINYETSAASRYERLPANSICRFNGVTYVANAGGIYALDADTDAGQPINAKVTLGTTDFSSKNRKRVNYVYIGFKSNAPMLITAVTDKETKTYTDVQPAGEGNRGTRAILGKGLEGLYWSFELANKEGAFFELDYLLMEAAISKRMGV